MAFADLDRPEVRFLEVALQGGKVDFSKVVKMIDDMVVLLAKEQTDDDGKREYCRKQIDNVEDKGKELEKGIEDHEITIEDETETIATLSEEITTLKADITELDKLVQESTEQRKNENAEFTQLMSENTEAKQLLKYAQNRLHKFYNPSLHNAESSKKGDEEEGTNAAALLQKETTSLHATGSHRADPGAAPTTWDGYATKAEESNSVISMIELLVRDLTKEMAMAQATEEHSQKEYEGFMQASAGKRAKTVKAVSIKNAAKADCEVAKTAHEADKKEATGKLEATRTYELQLHTECDWLVQNYDLRRTARADEIDTLKQAKAVLQGADFALVQGSKSGFLGHRSI